MDIRSYTVCISGTTLKDAIIQQKGLNASVAMCYMRDILLALCHLQEKQVLHEDLKGILFHPQRTEKCSSVE